jgi:thiol-disulfide isomerase/thioredoxin
MKTINSIFLLLFIVLIAVSFSSCTQKNTEKMGEYAEKLPVNSTRNDDPINIYNQAISENKPVVLVFNYQGVSCGPNARMEGVVNEIRQEYRRKIPVVQVFINDPSHEDACIYAGVRYYPTVYFIDRTGKITRMTDVRSTREDMLNMFRTEINKLLQI